eukprot:m.187984 g.187984  ORF g.187984 m.187984 type:complete len:117 (-) comp25630_c0_seq5:1703-2053(-)
MQNQLAERGKELSPAQREKILSCPACGNALYLVVLITELCNFGDFFQLDDKIAGFFFTSQPETPETPEIPFLFHVLLSSVFSRLALITCCPLLRPPQRLLAGERRCGFIRQGPPTA